MTTISFMTKTLDMYSNITNKYNFIPIQSILRKSFKMKPKILTEEEPEEVGRVSFLYFADSDKLTPQREHQKRINGTGDIMAVLNRLQFKKKTATQLSWTVISQIIVVVLMPTMPMANSFLLF